jgi:hypothetical protein
MQEEKEIRIRKYKKWREVVFLLPHWGRPGGGLPFNEKASHIARGFSIYSILQHLERQIINRLIKSTTT